MHVQECFTLDILLDYIRMVSYAVVVLSSLRGIFIRKFSNILFVGDIIMGISLIMTLAFSSVFKQNLQYGADLFLTVPAVIWAIIHYRALLRGNDNGKVVY